LWWRAEPARLKPEVIEAIATAGEVFVSAASAWEISIKRALGRIDIPEAVAVGVADSGFSELDVTLAHAERVADLPSHHRDPFDPLLLPQAHVDGLEFVSGESQLRK